MSDGKKISPAQQKKIDKFISAAGNGRKEIVEGMLSDLPGFRDYIDAAHSDDGMNALHSAAANDYLDVAEVLLAAGADVNALPKKREGWWSPEWSALQWAAAEGDGPQMLKLLASRGADPAIADHLGKTAANFLEDRTVYLKADEIALRRAAIEEGVREYKKTMFEKRLGAVCPRAERWNRPPELTSRNPGRVVDDE